VNRLREELKVIPWLAWVIAVALPCVVVIGGLFFAFGIAHTDGNEGPGRFMIAWPIFVCTIIAVSLFVYTLMVGYIAGDARRRGMRAVLWTLLAIFIPNAIGILLYFILREPLLRRCPRCGAGAKAAFPYCPSCGSTLAAVCPSCQSAIEPGWSHCARCGSKLSSTADPTPTQA
jgi:hypothetical protein